MKIVQYIDLMQRMKLSFDPQDTLSYRASLIKGTLHQGLKVKKLNDFSNSVSL